MAPKPKSPPEAPQRETIYEEESVEICKGKKALTAERARELLGWEEQPDKSKIYLITDFHKKKICCHNNVTNRPFYASVMMALKQEVLRGKWRLNCENRIIGHTGLVLNGQHTLVALVLAAQEWEANPDNWPLWKTEPTINTTIAFGADESDESVNTMDTCKPRSLADVIYRSAIFAGIPAKERREAARMLDHAVRLLWSRLGICLDAFAPRRTHSEALDFIQRHPHLLDCIRHVQTEDVPDEEGQRRVSRYLSSGYTSALLFLMASSKTKPEEYREADNPTDDLLDWSQYDKASDFIVKLAGEAESTKPVRQVLAKMVDNETDSLAAKCALLVKAWTVYASGSSITTKTLVLKWKTDPEWGTKTIDECPTTGGIDYGDPSSAEDAQSLRDAKEAANVKAPSPEQIKERTAVEREAKSSKPKPAAKVEKPKKKKGDPKNLVGKAAWVEEEDGEHWQGKIVQVLGKSVRLKVAQGFQGAGNTRTTTLGQIRSKQPA